VAQDEQDVQPDVVSEGTPSPEAEKPQAQPLTEERIQQIVDERLGSAKQEVERARRELQSWKDRTSNEVERARLAEETLASYQAGFRDIDPDNAELMRLKASDKAYKMTEYQRQQRQQAENFDRSFLGNMSQTIAEMGVDPNDKRIDWGERKGDYLADQRKILASAVKISKENAKVAQDKSVQQQKDREDKEREEVDSVDTSASVGVGGSDKDFLEKFGRGEVPYNKENVARVNKITKGG